MEKMKRPKRLNYPNGIYGDISYLKQLEKYCTYIENKIFSQKTSIIKK